MKRALLSAALAASGLIAAPHLVLAQNYQQPYQQPSQQPYQQPPGPPPGAPPQDGYQPPPPGYPPGPHHGGFWGQKQQRLDDISRRIAELQQEQACVQNAQDRHQLHDCQHPPPPPPR